MNTDNKKKQNPHPRATANPLSIITFGWTHKIFKEGFRKDLETEDMYGVLEEHQSDFLGNKLERMWNQELDRTSNMNKKPSLFKVLARCFGPKAIFLGLILGVLEIIFRMTQPLFLGGLIRYFSPGSDTSRSTAFIYAVCIFVCSFITVVVKQAYLLAMFHIGMKMRVAVCSLVYRKALRLTKTALGETSVGQAVNLLSNDVNRFDSCLVFFVYVWIGPVHTLIMLCLMWHEIGVAALIGVATVLLFIPVQVFLGKRISTLRLRTARRTDRRVRFMNEIIVGIQVIKMYAWEKPFAHLVSLARKLEIQAIRSAAYTRGLLLSFDYFATRFAVFVSVVSYYLLDNKITADRVFVVTAYFNIVKHVMTDFFPRAILSLSECRVSITRVQNFLLSDELVTAETVATLGHTDKPVTSEDKGIVMNGVMDQNINVDVAAGKKGIKIASITARWTEDLPENTLTDVSLDVRPGELVAIVGPVGSGKTSLLHAILKELPLSSGSISVGGSVSYASQEPWLFTGSVRQNILFGQPMDRNRYRQVVRVCALEQDFQLMPHGDRTIVGERGITLSGGQRARINLARTIYKEADAYLLDDPLSAVDTHVGRHLFDDCICGFLQGKTRLVVTHQLQYLQAADNIVILSNGTVGATGSFSELQESGLDFARQLNLDLEEEDKELKKGSVEHNYPRGSSGNMMRQNSETSQRSQSGSEPAQMSEMRTQGRVGLNVYRSYFASGGNCCFILLVFAVCVLVPVATRSGDYWMAYWTNVEELRAKSTKGSSEATLNLTSAALLSVTMTNDHIINATIYADDAPVLKNSTVSLPVAVSKEWGWMPSSETCIYVYNGLILAIIFLIILRVVCFFTMCTRASARLHDSMFSSITRATMAFFSHNPSGRILNRFTKDMGSVDESLPLTLLDCVQIGLSLLAVVIVVSIVNVWLLIPTVLMFVIFYVLRQYYLSTSRSLKRLEAISRSPVFSHISASLQGLTTIRSFGAQTLLEKEFDSHQDLHSSVWYVYIATNRAFGLWLDIVCSIYIGLVTLSFLTVGGKQYGGDVGLAITQAMMLTGMLQWGVRQSAELENQMTSVERLLEYTEVEKEPSPESAPDRKPPGSWPSEGIIVFDRIFLAYSENETSVLKNISFVTRPGEKVGIVGRTGAGKSSLIAALFRLVEVSSGHILIDGIDIASIGLHDLRSKISIIPQEPVLFSGTLRENLDPFNEYSDAALWAALAEVELKQVVDELPSGLSHRVLEGGSNFSVGQRQLLCLARAIVRNNKILVLDEATANVDPQTDELIQKTIRRKFTDCTVLTIAHRLHTVMDSDRILVMDAGSVVEFDHAHMLLKNENGYLYGMVQHAGHSMAESLLRVALESYGGRISKKV